MSQFINIEFPFKDSNEGMYVNLTKTSKDAVRSSLMHIILTQRGERMYMPTFGCNLKKYIFEQMDGITNDLIKEDITQSVSKHIPNLKIDSVNVDYENTQLTARVTIKYTITDNVFDESDIISIDI